MLTPKQRRFVEEYLVDLNATQASIRAGYSAKTAEQQGPRLLGNVGVAAAIAAAQAERSKRTQIDADWVLTRLARDATADIADLFDEQGKMRPVSEWTSAWRQGLVVGVESFEEYAYEDGSKVPVGMVRKLKLADRAKYIEMAGRHVGVGAFKDKVEHTGPNGGPVQVVGMTADEFKALASNIAREV